MAKNIVLIGFMGTGKTTIGLRLADRLRRTFVDMDREIESLNRMSVAEIFRLHGEIRFRSEEKLLAAKLSDREDLVIATGGGTVLDEENVAALKQNGVLVCLDADAVDIHARVSRKKGIRPLLGKGATVAAVEDMLQAREPFYACADLRIITTGKSLNETVNSIIDNLQIMGHLPVAPAGAGPASGGNPE